MRKTGRPLANKSMHLTEFRCRSTPQVMLDVDLTSDVKGREQLFLGLHGVFLLRASEEAEPVSNDG